PIIKSPRQGNWEGVEVEIIDSKNIKFILKKPYAPFVENLTLGILPAHVWKEATQEEFPFSKYNIEPVGSGPYKLSSIKYNASGVPEIITLKSWKRHLPSKPNIAKLEMRFFKNEEDMLRAFESGDILAIAGISPAIAKNLEANDFKTITP
ncbi:MAG: ABC transporter substrate-binding protein, partial [Patescibacteria group bacterium]